MVVWPKEHLQAIHHNTYLKALQVAYLAFAYAQKNTKTGLKQKNTAIPPLLLTRWISCHVTQKEIQ